jgi:hypothetical protein
MALLAKDEQVACNQLQKILDELKDMQQVRCQLAVSQCVPMGGRFKEYQLCPHARRTTLLPMGLLRCCCDPLQFVILE